MRNLAVLLAAAALASCAAGPDTYQADPRAQADLASLLAGKSAGPPVSCLPNYNSNDMRVIDGRNVAFRIGSQKLYLMHLSQGCHLLGSSNYALLTKQFGGQGLCRGDIAQVVDVLNRFTVGSCVIEGVVPYTTVGR